MKSGPTFAALATSCALLGNISEAENAISFATEVMKTSKSSTASGSQKLFMKLSNQEVARECSRVKEYISTRKAIDLKEKFGPFLQSSRVLFLPKPKQQRIDFQKVFKNGLPLKLEVCSGHGDWIVERAQQSNDSCNWAALEIRNERLFQIWSRMIFNDLNNLLILGGEAHAIFNESINDCSIQEIFVNYPDPPVWEGSKQRLLDEFFLADVHRALCVGGVVTIVTDDKDYCNIVAKEFSMLEKKFTSAFAPLLFVNQLPEGYGSSYFDRMWKNGKRKTRYFLKYFKGNNSLSVLST